MPDPLDYTQYDTRLGAYAVVVDERDHVLLALWNELDEPRWTLPGGGVELHETTADAAVREVHEETGYDVELGALLGVDTLVLAPHERLVPGHRYLKAVRVVYAASTVAGTLRAEVDGTTDEARWFPLAEVPSLARIELVDAGLRLWAARDAD